MEGNMSGVEKRWEGKCLGWKNGWRIYVRGVKNDGSEYVRFPDNFLLRNTGMIDFCTHTKRAT